MPRVVERTAKQLVECGQSPAQRPGGTEDHDFFLFQCEGKCTGKGYELRMKSESTSTFNEIARLYFSFFFRLLFVFYTAHTASRRIVPVEFPKLLWPG